MRIILVFFITLLLVGCQSEQPATPKDTTEELSTTDSKGASDEETFYTEEDLEEAREEAFQEGYDEGYEAGNDEGYELGYSDAVEESEVTALPSSSSSSSNISDLNLFSDGFDWDLALEFEKKEFIRSVLEANGQIVTFSELDQYIFAIDNYYENNLRMNTLQEALGSFQ